MIVNKKYLYKSLTWRIISIITSFSLSYIMMDGWQEAMRYTIAYSIISTILYYFHELYYKQRKFKNGSKPKEM